MSPDGIVHLWVDKDQVNEMILFLEQSIIPNLSTKYEDKSSELIFSCMRLSSIPRPREEKHLSIILNDEDGYEFWTESCAEDIGELVPILTKINSKELDF